MSTGDIDHVPTEAKQMYAIGPRTEGAIREMFRPQQYALFVDPAHQSLIPVADIELLSRSLTQPPRWSDAEAEALILGLSSKLQSGNRVDVSLVSRWVLAHQNDSASVLLCLGVQPPDEIEIRKVLSQAGSQKVVFLASWRLTQKDVVVKRLLESGAMVHDLEAFPLNLSHHNIIETYRLQNGLGELFLVEDLLPDVLSDSWRAQGVQEAANLLHDIGAAIKYLHEHDRVHGDIKPDNIGRRDGDFVLLDFGICRPIADFTRDATATGSLRTRAPELLPHSIYVDPPKVDVWALGATLFSALVGRFPLIEPGETIPRISQLELRAAFEKELNRRATEEWERRVDLSSVPTELRGVLQMTLARDPANRATSSELLEKITNSLPAYLHGGDARARRDSRFSPLEELTQLSDYIVALPAGTLLPGRVRDGLKDRLKQLSATPGFTLHDQKRADQLITQLTRLNS